MCLNDLPKYHYYLPNQDVDPEEERHETEVNSVVLIGANGSGKTRLGEWLERKYPQEVQRISSLRNLSLPREIKLSSFNVAINQMMYGRDTARSDHSSLYEFERSVLRHKTVTGSVSNFEPSVSAIIAKDNDANRLISREVTNTVNSALEHTTVNKAQTRPEVRMRALFSSVFPHRSIFIHENTVYAMDSEKTLSPETAAEGYNGCDLSDGERAALYVIAQALCLPPNMIIVVDEPELHLHRSVIKPLWAAIERERPDCLFIYITHDLEFAEAHRESDKIWVRGYDGEKWRFEYIREDEGLPSDLELEIMGSRRPVIFVEGTHSSFDYQLYSLLYPQHQIVPCEHGCQQVIESVCAFRKSERLHRADVYGIIDRDRRSKEQISSLSKKGIYVLEVAEVENLFLLEDVMSIVAKQMGLPQSSVEETKQYIIGIKFKNQVDSLVADYFCGVMTDRLKGSAATRDVKQTADLIRKISDDAEQLRDDIDKRFRDVCQSNDYAEVLSLLNNKGVAKIVGKRFGLQNSSYIGSILRWAKSPDEIGNQFRQAFRKHLPSFQSDDFSS